MYGGGSEGNQHRQMGRLICLEVEKGRKKEEEDREKFSQKRKRGRKI
jgi:hypothetical protein